jgi:hypothetical protein
MDKCVLCLVCALRMASAQTAELRGQTVDPSIAALPRALVRLSSTGEKSATFKSETDLNGTFVIRDVPPGDYRLRIWVRAFRPRTLAVKLNPGDLKDLGDIRLELAGCDAPGVNCDYIGDPPHIESQGFITLKQDWSVDLDTGTVFQSDSMNPGHQNKSADVLLLHDSNLWNMTPVNGATLSQTDCASAKFATTAINLNELELGDEICVKTDRHNYAHIFVVDGIGVGGPMIRFWHVTH